MAICSINPYNFTFTFAMNGFQQESDLLNIRNGSLSGPYGNFVMREGFLDEPENIRRAQVCRFVKVNKTGDYDPTTGRYDGAIGDIADGKADSFFRVMQYGTIDPEYVGYLGVPFAVLDFLTGQLIERFASQKVEQSLSSLCQFLMPSTAFLVLMAAGCLLYQLSSALFRKSKSSKRKLRLKMLSLFYLLFLFFMRQFFSGNLNTENVVVNTDDLLYSEDQILKTTKEFCPMEKGPEFDFLENAPRNSLLHQIYEKRNKEDMCFVYSGTDFNSFSQGESQRFFTLIPGPLLDFLTKTLGGLIESDTYVESNLVVYESLRTFIVKKSMEIEKKKYFEKFSRTWTEHGYVVRIFRNIPDLLGFNGKKDGQNSFMHYNTLQEYLAANTRLTAFRLDKLDYLFRGYFALVTAILFFNLVHYWLKKIHIRRIRIWFCRNLLALKTLNLGVSAKTRNLKFKF